METMTIDQFKQAIKDQGHKRIEDATFECPQCKTLQSAQNLIDAGAGNSFDEVEKYLAFSCIGRFDEDQGCNWSLGGFLQLHDLEVITPDGESHPRFMPRPAL